MLKDTFFSNYVLEIDVISSLFRYFKIFTWYLFLNSGLLGSTFNFTVLFVILPGVLMFPFSDIIVTKISDHAPIVFNDCG